MNAPDAIARGAVAAEPDLRLFDDLDALAADADGALDRARQPSAYDRIGWLWLIRDHVLPGATLVAARARIGADRCWLFLKADGDRAEPYARWYTLAFAPVFDAAPDARSGLIEAIARGLRARFARIDLAPMATDEADRVAAAFAAAGWWASAEDATANWVAYTAGMDFAGYWAARPSRLRNTVRRKARGSDLDIAIFDGFDDGRWDAYEAIYRESWKPAEGSPAFLRAFARAEGAAGTLRFGLAMRAGVPIACQFWTVDHGIATIHKLAHRESERAASPGTILSEAMFRHVIERDRPALIDFGTGDDGYKADWMDERRMMRRVTLHNRRSIAGIAGAARAAGAAWWKALRHG